MTFPRNEAGQDLRGQGMTPTFLYHVTHQDNEISIHNFGIDPRKKYPERLLTTSYFVEQSALAWAIAHTTERHSTLPRHLVIYKVKSAGRGFKKFFGKGIYKTEKTFMLDRDDRATHFASVVLGWIREDKDLDLMDWLNEIPF
jgi:hypothetical protein